jgi:hypothetical protein
MASNIQVPSVAVSVEDKGLSMCFLRYEDKFSPISSMTRKLPICFGLEDDDEDEDKLEDDED